MPPQRQLSGEEMQDGSEKSKANGATAHVILVTCLLLFFTVSLSLISTNLFPGALDELEHISYAAYLQETGRILPKFDEHRRLLVGDMGRWDDRPNYVGHPSPFYVFIGLFLDRALPAEQAILAPRLASTGLLLVGVAAALCAGRRHFGQDPWALLVFCLLLALCPKLLTVSSQVSNDSLAFLGGALAYWGAGDEGRDEGRRRWFGSAAVALGLIFALWAKPSAGLAVGAWLGTFFLLAPPHRPRLLLPLGCGLAVGVVPYLFMIRDYGALVPVTAEDVANIDHMDSFASYLPTFLLTLGYMWSISPTHAWSTSRIGDLATIALFWAMIACAALGGCLAWRSRSETRAALAAAAPAAFALVLPIHLWFASTSLGYSLPAASFRYYLPLWPPLAHAIAFAVVTARTPRRRVPLAWLAFAALAVGWASL